MKLLVRLVVERKAGRCGVEVAGGFGKGGAVQVKAGEFVMVGALRRKQGSDVAGRNLSF